MSGDQRLRTKLIPYPLIQVRGSTSIYSGTTSNFQVNLNSAEDITDQKKLIKFKGEGVFLGKSTMLQVAYLLIKGLRHRVFRRNFE